MGRWIFSLSLVDKSLLSRLIDVFVDFGEFRKEIKSGFYLCQGFSLRKMFFLVFAFVY